MAKMKVVFLHGIGDGDSAYVWLDGLNRGLAQLGYDEVTREEVIAPRYGSFLKTDGISAKLPPITYKPKDDRPDRRNFERRQAGVQRLLKSTFGVGTFGFDRIPNFVWEALPEFVIDMLPLGDLKQVQRYVRSESIRAAVMLHILDHLPSYGDVMIIGHSLGSVVAIDLLDHLPEALHVRRFITIGSPANIRALHEGSERLLKKFPYSRVDDWSNFLNARDIVTGGRGLASTFPGAQDFMLSIAGHGAGTYLGDPAVAGLVADALYPTKDIAVSRADVAVRLSDPEASVLLSLHFAEAVGHNIDNDERSERYQAILKILRDDAAAQLRQQAGAGKLLAPELHELSRGQLPSLPHRWEIHEVVGELVVLALTNCVSPYEIDVADAPVKALEDIAVALGFQRQIGKTAAAAIRDVERCLGAKGNSVPWGRVLTAAAGIAIVAAGPIGLMVAAPAGVFGGAAIVGGLAAFGPGGMVGGLAMLGGLAGGGAAVAAAAAAGGGGRRIPHPISPISLCAWRWSMPRRCSTYRTTLHCGINSPTTSRRFPRRSTG